MKSLAIMFLITLKSKALVPTAMSKLKEAW